MKKRISVIFTALFLSFALCVPVLAANRTMNYVIDADNLLTYEEWEPLEDQAAEISRRHGCGVYVMVVDNYTTYGSESIYDTAAKIYHDDSFGEGAGLDGILLLVSMSTRDYALFVCGEYAEYAFNSYGQSMVEDAFLPSLSENDWRGGFSAYLTACDEYLTLAAEGAPLQESPVGGILMAVGISCAIALVVCLVLKGKMKSVRRKAEAQTYVTPDGLCLTDSYDRYTHTTETRRRIEKNNSSSHSGGGGSGRSGKF